MIVEIREARFIGRNVGVFAFLRMIPILNDFAPFPEGRRNPQKTKFECEHEEGHKVFYHSVLRNLQKFIFLILAVGFLSYLLNRENFSLWQSILWLHLVAIPFRVFFHFYCWRQEFEADAYAYHKVGKQNSKWMINELVASEIPHTHFFALLYREHPMAILRRKQLSKK